MGRPRSIDDESILKIARAVFLEQGFSATTAEIAQRAGISEGSIFNRFGSKRGLFKRAMQLSIAEEPWLLALPERVGQGDVQSNLVEVGEQIVAFFRRMMPVMMMAWSNPAGGQRRPEDFGPGKAPLIAIRAIGGYLEAEMALGRIRRVDAEILARALLAGLSNYAFFEVLLKQQGQLPLPVGMYVRGLVDVLWNGVAPHDQEDG